MEVKNETIVITDPCYIVKDAEDYSKELGIAISALDEKYDDWRKCDYGYHMEALGLKNFISESTIYGDWTCTTFKVKGNPIKAIHKRLSEKLGTFCADSGEVGVFLLSELEKYNPNWNNEKEFTRTIIPNFTGTVNYYVDNSSIDPTAHIIGTGNINFVTIQTGL